MIPRILLAVFSVAFVLASQAMADTTIIIQRTPRVRYVAPAVTYVPQVAIPVVTAPPVMTAPVPDPVVTYQAAPVVTYQRSYVYSSVRAGGGCPLCPAGLAAERRHSRQSARHAGKAAYHAERAAYHADRS